MKTIKVYVALKNNICKTNNTKKNNTNLSNLSNLSNLTKPVLVKKYIKQTMNGKKN